MADRCTKADRCAARRAEAQASIMRAAIGRALAADPALAAAVRRGDRLERSYRGADRLPAVVLARDAGRMDPAAGRTPAQARSRTVVA